MNRTATYHACLWDRTLERIKLKRSRAREGVEGEKRSPPSHDGGYNII